MIKILIYKNKIFKKMKFIKIFKNKIFYRIINIKIFNKTINNLIHKF
jgi:hypothetical protein